MFSKKQLILKILKIAARAVIAAVVAVIVVIFFSQRISKISFSLAEPRATAFFLGKRRETTAQLGEDFKIVGEADKKMNDAFPPTDNILGFVGALETLALRNSLQQSFSFGTPADSGIDYNIILNGNIFIFINYLKDFERLPFFTAISSVSLSAPGGWEGNSTISMRAKVWTK